MTVKELEVRFNAHDMEITEIKRDLLQTKKATELLKANMNHANDEQKSSFDHMLQMIMVWFDRMEKGENSKSDDQREEIPTSSRAKEKMPDGDVCISEASQSKVPHTTKNKMEVLVFHDEDVEGWLWGIEMYFKVHLISNADQLECITPNLEGAAL